MARQTHQIGYRRLVVWFELNERAVQVAKHLLKVGFIEERAAPAVEWGMLQQNVVTKGDVLHELNK